MGASEGVIRAIDEVIAFFNSRRMDLPDGFFERKTQFVINGAPFETLLGQSPTDPLILMLSRGPAGYRFTAKALQHALTDARIERPSTPQAQPVEPASLRTGGTSTVAFHLTVAGKLRDTGEAVNAVAAISLILNEAGSVVVAEATLDEAVLEKIRQARRS